MSFFKNPQPTFFPKFLFRLKLCKKTKYYVNILILLPMVRGRVDTMLILERHLRTNSPMVLLEYTLFDEHIVRMVLGMKMTQN